MEESDSQAQRDWQADQAGVLIWKNGLVTPDLFRRTADGEWKSRTPKPNGIGKPTKQEFKSKSRLCLQ